MAKCIGPCQQIKVENCYCHPQQLLSWGVVLNVRKRAAEQCYLYFLSTAPFQNFSMALPNLWKIYASFRTPEEERHFSRSAFFKFSGYILSCIVMTILASRSSNTKPKLTY